MGLWDDVLWRRRRDEAVNKSLRRGPCSWNLVIKLHLYLTLTVLYHYLDLTNGFLLMVVASLSYLKRSYKAIIDLQLIINVAKCTWDKPLQRCSHWGRLEAGISIILTTVCRCSAISSQILLAVCFPYSYHRRQQNNKIYCVATCKNAPPNSSSESSWAISSD